MGTGQGHRDFGGHGHASGPASGGGGVVSAPMSQSAAVSGVVNGPRERHGAIVLDKSRPNGKRLARILVSAGYSVKTYEEETAQSLAAIIASEPDMASWL